MWDHCISENPGCNQEIIGHSQGEHQDSKLHILFLNIVRHNNKENNLEERNIGSNLVHFVTLSGILVARRCEIADDEERVPDFLDHVNEPEIGVLFCLFGTFGQI